MGFTGASARADTTITIATVNNGDMVVMQKLSSTFEKQHPDIHLRWVVLEENVLRQRVTTDIATKAGQFDIVTVGNYEVPIWAKQGWLAPMDNLPASYDVDDLLKPVRAGLTYEGKLYGLPFYAESAMTYYRTDLFNKAGLKMPEAPTYEQIRGFADKITDKPNQVYGMCLRGKPGWGENMAYVTTLVDTYGGQWFDMKWNPTINTPEWKKAVTFYDDILKADGPPGATSNGFNENLALFASGHCGMWIDATVAGRPAVRQEAVAGGRQGGLRADPGRRFQGRPDLAVELEPFHPRDFQAEGRGEDLRYLGDVEGLHQAGGREQRLGRRAARHASLDLRESRLHEGGAVRRVCSNRDRPGQPDRQHARAEALSGCPVRRDPRVPGHRHASRPDDSRDPDRTVHRRSSPRGRAIRHRADHAPSRLPEVAAHEPGHDRDP